MGFFSDLKEDLSQAVNELMPEEALDAAMASGESGGQLTNEIPLPDKPSEAVDSVDLSSMLDNLEEPGTTDKPLEEAVISPDAMAEITEAMPEPAETEAAEEPGITAGAGITEEPEPIPELTEEPGAIPTVEIEAAAEAEPQGVNNISELSGEEEKTMDEQTQVQTQAHANRVPVDETAVVTEGMTITGDIVSEGSMELIGTVNGNLDILGKLNITGNIQGDSKAAEIFAEGAKITGEVHSQGSVKIGQSSVVIGNIAAASAVIAGAVKGDIDVQGPVILDTTAIVMGNIKSKSVQINNGAVIEGLCSQCYADVNPSSFFEEFKKKKG